MAAETLKLEAQCHPRAHGKQEQNGSGGGESRVVPKQPHILFAPAWKISFFTLYTRDLAFSHRFSSSAMKRRH